MPITVVLSDALEKKMQTVAIPLKDTYVTVIERAVDALIEKVHGPQPSAQPVIAEPSGSAVYAADAAPSLTFTKPSEITLDGKPLPKQALYWNPLLFKVVSLAATKLNPLQLRQALLVNYVEGKNENSGFRYISEAGLSVQGADANDAWKATIHLVKAAGLKIDVVFRWETKEGAAKPGEFGRMTYEPA
jgi:hypothetical protein